MKHFNLSSQLRVGLAAVLFFTLAPAAAIAYFCAAPCCHPVEMKMNGCCSGARETSCRFEKSSPDTEALAGFQPARKKPESVSYPPDIRETEAPREGRQSLARRFGSNVFPRSSPLFIRFHSLLI